MNQEELWNWMMDAKDEHKWRYAIATLSRPITIKKWQGHGIPDIVENWPKGMKVKAVMASRFGDIGITDDLEAANGYHHRTQAVQGGPVGSELPADDLLLDIQPLNDSKDNMKLKTIARLAHGTT